MNGVHVRRIELGQTYRASPATPLTAVQWKWRERGALPQVFILASVASESEPTETGKFTFRRKWTSLLMLPSISLIYSNTIVETSYCLLLLLQNIAVTVAEWQEWGGWSQCTASCGQGLKIRARGCSEPEVGGNLLCPGNVSEIEECKTSECSGNPLLYPWWPILNLITLQPLLPNGKTGAIGLNAQPLVARGWKSGLELAVNQSLEATTSVLGMRQRLTIARHLIVQVIKWCFVHGCSNVLVHFRPNKLGSRFSLLCW